MSRFWKIAASTAAVAALALVAVVGGVWGRPTAGGSKSAPTADTSADAVPVTVVAARALPIPVYATALGTVSALNTVTVSPQVGAQLLSVDFHEGQQVHRGDVLARLDTRILQANYEAATATTRQNQALLATARANFTRSSAPAYQQYVSRTELDAQRNLVSQYEGAVAASDANMRAARVQLQYAQVRAPISGVAGIRKVDAGNIVAAGTPLVTLTQTHPINVIFNLPERQLDAVRRAQQQGPVIVSVLDRDQEKALTSNGRLDVVDNQISADSGTFRARAVFQNDDDALWPGQFVNVRLQLRIIDDAIVVPLQAVMRGPGGEYVYVVQPDSTVRMQPVRSGTALDDSRMQISKGVKAGDKVVIEGQFRIKPGSLVTALAPGQMTGEGSESASNAVSAQAAASLR
jgi:multidrug efflux system membrane fusion protein